MLQGARNGSSAAGGMNMLHNWSQVTTEEALTHSHRARLTTTPRLHQVVPTSSKPHTFLSRLRSVFTSRRAAQGLRVHRGLTHGCAGGRGSAVHHPVGALESQYCLLSTPALHKVGHQLAVCPHLLLHAPLQAQPALWKLPAAHPGGRVRLISQYELTVLTSLQPLASHQDHH